MHSHCRDNFVYASSQWGTALQCNAISQWLGAYTEWSLTLAGLNSLLPRAICQHCRRIFQNSFLWKHFNFFKIVFSKVFYVMVIKWTLRNKIPWNFNPNTTIFIWENEFENIICKKAVILSRPHYVVTLTFLKLSWIIWRRLITLK